MQLYLMAPTISALLVVLTAAFFHSPAHFIFLPQTKGTNADIPRWRKSLFVRVPLILPPSLKTRARLQLFVGLTLAERVFLHCGSHIESVISSATQWPLLGETQYHLRKKKRGDPVGGAEE